MTKVTITLSPAAALFFQKLEKERDEMTPELVMNYLLELKREFPEAWPDVLKALRNNDFEGAIAALQKDTKP